MNVEVRRRWETSRSITGEMWIDGQFECYTLEPARTNPVHAGHPCIPAGEYKVILTVSPHLGYLCPEVLDVPGRTKIRWHIGNGPEDVEGCAAVGQTLGVDRVFASTPAFSRLMTLLKTERDDITVKYLDPPLPANDPRATSAT